MQKKKVSSVWLGQIWLPCEHAAIL
jgi:hypothetical protein